VHGAGQTIDERIQPGGENGVQIGAPNPAAAQGGGIEHDAGAGEGLEFDLVVVVRPESFGAGVEGGVDRYLPLPTSR